MKRILFLSFIISVHVVKGQTYPSGMIGYWSFDNNANDISGNGNHGVVHGAELTADRFGSANKAYAFNGNSYIEVTNSDPYNITTAITLSAWTKFSSLRTNTFIAKWSAGDYDENQSYALGTFGQAQHLVTGTVHLTNSNTPLAATKDGYGDGQWHLHTMTFDGASTKIYVDGVLISQVSSVGVMASTTAPLVFGGITPTIRYMDLIGSLDEVMIFNRALTAQEVNQVYVATGGNDVFRTPPPVPSSTLNGIVGHWPFDGNANDTSGNGSNGVVTGASLTADRFGHEGKAYLFDGHSYISIPNPTFFDLQQQFTLSLWAKFSVQDHLGLFMAKWSGGNYDGKSAYFVGTDYGAPAGSISFGISNEGNASYLTSSNTYADNQWHHISLVYTGTKASLFVDGIKQAEKIGISTLLDNTSVPLFFGGLSARNDQNFTGALDEITVYNRALTSSEITSLLSQGCTPPTLSIQSAQANGEYSFSPLFSGENCVATYKWDFGDSATSQVQSPKHTYQSGGKFVVRLTVSYQCTGCPANQVIAEEEISVEGKICPNLYCDSQGGVGINTHHVPAPYQLAVGGKIICEGVRAEYQAKWPDYVFGRDYQLKKLSDLKSFINKNGHLPEAPSAAEVKKEGIDLVEMNALLLKKMEEMTLYVIKQDEQMKQMASRLMQMEENLQQLKKENRLK